MFLVLSVFVLSYTLLGSCALMDIRTSQALHHLEALLTPCSSHLACGRADSILSWLLFLRSRHSSHMLICGKCRNWWGHNFRSKGPQGSKARARSGTTAGVPCSLAPALGRLLCPCWNVVQLWVPIAIHVRRRCPFACRSSLHC